MKTTERDVCLLERVNAFGFMSVEQIAEFWQVEFSTAARRVRKLIEAGLLMRLELDALSARPLVVTKAGCALVGDTIPPMRGIRLGTYRHDTMMVDLALAMERRFGATFETERQLRSQPGPVAGHLPDGILHLPDGRSVGAELELTQKSQQRLSDIMAIHAGNLALDAVWYVIVDEAMRPVLRRHPLDGLATGRFRNHGIVAGWTRDEARIWYALGMMAEVSSRADLLTSIARFHPQNPEAHLAALEEEFPSQTYTQYEEIFLSRAIYRDQALRTLATHADAGGIGCGYEFSWVPAFEHGRLGAAHGFDEPFVFGDLSTIPLAQNDADASMLAKEMSSVLIDYARNGACRFSGTSPRRSGLWSLAFTGGSPR